MNAVERHSIDDDDDDIFAGVLNLEEQYYREGYAEGRRDGAAAGRAEGRSVGYKTGFDKFVEAGRAQGRALVWANRIPGFRHNIITTTATTTTTTTTTSTTTSSSSPSSAGKKEEEEEEEVEERGQLPDLPANPRLQRHVAALYGLVEPGTLSTRNDDESVADFDSRMKGAQGRLRVVERAVGEAPAPAPAPAAMGATGAGAVEKGKKNENIEDIGGPVVRRREGDVGDSSSGRGGVSE
ncbi:DUF1715-domain-containing protein [Biscogniauxia sp. FL1348]|nr:DUF1715-domain-containing protein [Biscogniauxia sp. FL1348]